MTAGRPVGRSENPNYRTSSASARSLSAKAALALRSRRVRAPRFARWMKRASFPTDRFGRRVAHGEFRQWQGKVIGAD